MCPSSLFMWSSHRISLVVLQRVSSIDWMKKPSELGDLSVQGGSLFVAANHT